jgi:hypothetical protein
MPLQLKSGPAKKPISIALLLRLTAEEPFPRGTDHRKPSRPNAGLGQEEPSVMG